MKNLNLNKNQSITLGIIQQLRIGQHLKIKKIAKNDPSKFIQLVKELIDIGYCEYEFSNDYEDVKRLNLPEYAKDYFTKLNLDYEQSKQNIEPSDKVTNTNPGD